LFISINYSKKNTKKIRLKRLTIDISNNKKSIMLLNYKYIDDK